VLAEVHPKAALEVFERDCLIYLGTAVAAKGEGKPGKQCFSYQIKGATLNESGEMNYGEIKLLPLGPGETAQVTIDPSRGFDFGAGPGKRIERTVKGGTVGLILDARGRPLRLPEERAACQSTMSKWVDAMKMYPAESSAR